MKINTLTPQHLPTIHVQYESTRLLTTDYNTSIGKFTLQVADGYIYPRNTKFLMPDEVINAILMGPAVSYWWPSSTPVRRDLGKSLA
jgi:hypothetical protein